MIYLDNSATTAPLPEVIEVVKNLLDNEIYGNPNSIYNFGLESRRLIENARKIIADKINCQPNEVYFLSNASYASAQAIVGYINNPKNNCYDFVTTNLEHSSISEITFYNENNIKKINKHIIKCNDKGLLYPDKFKDIKNSIVAFTGCNSEIATIQPIKEIAKVLHKNNNTVYCDLTQYIPYNKVDLKELNLDMACFSSHKIHGLKNCGVLYIKNGISLSPIVYGHNMIENGTPDIYQICAMAKAVEMLSYDDNQDLLKKRDYLLNKLLTIKGIELNGSYISRSPNNINICYWNTALCLDSQQLVSLFDLMGYCISAASACSSYSNKPSQTLLAINRTQDEAKHSIRITIGKSNTYEELDKFFNDFKNIINQYTK